MGKYPDSPIHKDFSNWHYQRCNSTSYLSDIDRLWVELRGKKMVGVFDLKYYGPMDQINMQERTIADFFESHGVPFYFAYTNKDFSSWTLYRHKTRKSHAFTEQMMIAWIDSGLPEWR